MVNMMEVDFSKNGDGLVPAIVQDARTGRVLMLGYMNDDALAETKKSGRVTFYSRSKERLWTKGETSGNYLQFVDMLSDCDRDALLVKAIPSGPVCHTGSQTCFAETEGSGDFLSELESVIRERREIPVDGSYSCSLFAKGIDKIAQKVGEEAVELVIEAMRADDERLKSEAADLIYHLLVLLAARGIALGDVVDVLRSRSHTR